MCGWKNTKRYGYSRHVNFGELVLESEVTLCFLILAKVYDLKLYEVLNSS